MARYIKANPKVAKFLNLESERNTVKDGNYLLWQNDMLKFGPLTRLNETLEQIGGIALLAHEAREEQEGTVTRSLPQATDERFVMPVTVEQSEDLNDIEQMPEPSEDAAEAEPEQDENAEEEDSAMSNQIKEETENE